MRALSIFLLSTCVAFAQNPVKQSGNVTPGHAAVWTTTGVIQDGGTATSGNLTSLGITSSGPGFCQNTAKTGPFYQFCLGITSGGSGTISLNGFGGATNANLLLNINGASYSFPYTVGGIVGPNTSTVGHFALWNNSSGSLLADGGAPGALANLGVGIGLQSAGGNLNTAPAAALTMRANPTGSTTYDQDVSLFAFLNASTPITITPNAAPSSLAPWTSYANAFTGDNSKIIYGEKYSITGTASLGQPTTGYMYTPELTPYVMYMENYSGWNQGTADNTGRTAAVTNQVWLNQNGQGDAVAYNAIITVNSTRAGATSFLANPAGTIINGQISAGAAGAFLNPTQYNMVDFGFDAAAVGMDMFMERTNSTGALGAYWKGYIVQSVGSAPIDSGFYIAGLTRVGIDFTAIGTQASGTWTQAAIVLKGNDRIYFNGTPSSLGQAPVSTGSDYINFDNSTGALLLHSGITGVLSSGHVLHAQSGTVTSVTTCGTSPSISGDDRRGTVTFGSGSVTTCNVVFGSAYPGTPTCIVSGTSDTINAYVLATSNSALVIGTSASFPGGNINYLCEG